MPSKHAKPSATQQWVNTEELDVNFIYLTSVYQHRFVIGFLTPRRFIEKHLDTVSYNADLLVTDLDLEPIYDT